MGIVIRQSFWSSVSAYAGVLIGYANVILLMPKFMEPEQIGLFRTIISIAMLFVNLGMVGMGNTLIRFKPKYQELGAERLARFFGFSITLIAISCCLLAGAFYFFQDSFYSLFQSKSPEVNEYLWLIFILLVEMIFFTFLQLIAKTYQEIIFSNVLRDVGYKAANLILIVCYGVGWLSFHHYLISHVVVYLILIAANLVHIRAKFNIKFTLTWWDKEIFQDIYRYVGYAILAGLGSTMILQIDQILVTKYLGLELNGIYTTAIFMVVAIELPKRFIAQIATPILSEAFNDRNLKAINKLYQQGSVNQLLLGGGLFLLIAINLDNIYSLMPKGEVYEVGKWVVLIVGSTKVIDMAFSMNGEIITFSKLYRYNVLLTFLLGGLTLGGNILLIPRFGMMGAAWTIFGSYLIFNLVKYLLLKAVYKFEPFTGKTMVAVVILTAPFLVNHFIPFLVHPLVDIAIRSMVAGGIFLSLVYLFKPSQEVVQIMENVFQRVYILLIKK